MGKGGGEISPIATTFGSALVLTHNRQIKSLGKTKMAVQSAFGTTRNYGVGMIIAAVLNPKIPRQLQHS